MDWMAFFVLLFPAGFLVGLSLAMHRWPPNAINRAYGYRTRRSMASQEAWDYAQPRSIRLMRDWTWWMVAWTVLVPWRWGLENGVLILCGLMTLGVLLPLIFVERELKGTAPFTPKGGVNRVALAVTAFLLLSVFRPITHDGGEREREVRGTLETVAWNVSSADVFLRMRDDACHYYINRGLDMGIDTASWKAKLPGRSLTLQVVDRPAGLNWFGKVGPVRGVVLGTDTLYRTGRVHNP
jgi:hypothetical protein